MKKIAFIVILLVLVGVSNGDESTQGAIKFYMSMASWPTQYDHILITQLDFRGNGRPDIVISYSYTDYFKRVGNMWTVLEQRHGGWVALDALNEDGKQDSQIAFDEDRAGFVYLKKYKHSGILIRYARWVFIYLDGNTFKSVMFDAAQIGMTDEQLDKLRAAHKIAVQEMVVPQKKEKGVIH